MANAIIKINKRAKQLQRSHKSWAWKDCIQKASSEYRNGKLGASKASSSRQTGKSNKKKDSQRSARPPGARVPKGGKKVTYYERRKNRSDVPGQLTGMSISKMKTEIKNRLKEKLGKQLVSRTLAKGKMAKRKILKQIAITSQQLKKIS